jgi:hypothetical protein
MPARRLELRIGRFGMADFIHAHSVGSDNHRQFLNWDIDQNRAYDFSGNARGYTWGVYAEYQSLLWGGRFAEAPMPGPNNGGPLAWDLRKTPTSNAEFELHRAVLPNKNGLVTLLVDLNRANMGVYTYAIGHYLEGKVAHPDIDNHPFHVTTK